MIAATHHGVPQPARAAWPWFTPCEDDAFELDIGPLFPDVGSTERHAHSTERPR